MVIPEDKIEVKFSSSTLITYSVIGALIAAIFLGCSVTYAADYDSSATAFFGFLAALFLAWSLGSLNRIVTNESEIILTKEGIEFRKSKLYEWSSITEFSFTVENDNGNYINLKVEAKAYINFSISDLEMDADEFEALFKGYYVLFADIKLDVGG